MAETRKPKPIYLHTLTARAWQLHWWMIAHMDTNGCVNSGWRTRASEELGVDRAWLSDCSKALRNVGLIESSGKKASSVRVCVERITG